MVGVSELGTDVDALEESLRKILDIASEWNAVLLLDEADIFMEARSNMDVHRNAMVGVFLRLLEYYEGVLFLTTNRAKNIDKAFFSRINMAIHYPDLDEADRFQIWTNVLGLYGITSLTENDIEELAEYEINGRQIKGMIRIAAGLAQSKGKEVGVSDIVQVIEKAEEFADYMEEEGNEIHTAFTANNETVYEKTWSVSFDAPTLFQRFGNAFKAFFA